MSRENTNLVRENERYVKWEKLFVEHTRSTLAGQGYPNSGITMNWVKKDGKRTYTVSVHHRRIGRLAKEEKEQLVQTLMQEKFGDEDCSVLVVLQD